MSKYYFLLGSTPALSRWELESVLGDTAIIDLTDQIVAAELPTDDTAQTLMATLGGTIKMYRHLETVEKETELVRTIGEHLRQKQEKPHFGLAYYGFAAKEPSLQDIKQYLSEQGIASRYVESDMAGLSASILLHQKKVTEIALLKQGDATIVAELVGIQDIDSWTIRDRQKPYADRKKGMLPPKLARMMVNLAAASRSAEPAAFTVYDPFCGTGTVLLEAAMLGYRVIGSDASRESVEGTQANLNWLAEATPIHVNSHLFVSDASQVATAIEPHAIDAIVTEPFLGKQTPQVSKLPNIFKGLEKMYLGAFKNWQKILKPGASVVIVLPSVETGTKTFTLDAFVDKLTQLGYTISSGPVQYARPGAVVKRNLYKFTYNS